MKDKVIEVNRVTRVNFPLSDKAEFAGVFTGEVTPEAVNTLITMLEVMKSSFPREAQIEYSVPTITDGATTWSAICPECGEEAMHVVRPGKVQCGNCG